MNDNIFHQYLMSHLFKIEHPLEKISREAAELVAKEKELEAQAKEYCKGKKFRIVKHIYYSGYQGDMIGRECYIHPTIWNGELQATCTIYNKRTKKIDIPHYYLHDMSFYEEIRDAK